MFEIEALVLANTNRPYTKKDGSQTVYKSVTVRLELNGQKELVTLPTKADCGAYLDQDVVLEVSPRVYKGEVTGLEVVGVK